MKQFKFYTLIALGALLLGCSEDDKLVDEVVDATTRGAVLRTISIAPNAFLFDDTDSPWTVTWEEQDYEDGELLESVDVYVNFVDTTPSNGSTTSTETLLETIPASAFATGANGLPRTTYTVMYGEALSALGLAYDPAVVTGGDQIVIRPVLNLTDGRSISATDLSGPVAGGSYFAAPMTYTANIVCPAKAGTPGTWAISMQDSYGDGWNGASLSVTLDGVTTDYLVEAGFTNAATFDVPADAESLSIVYNSGDWDSEVTFQVVNPSSATILSLGPTPPAGVELLDYCSDF